VGKLVCIRRNAGAEKLSKPTAFGSSSLYKYSKPLL